MGDDDQRGGPGGEVGREPGHRLDVEVVGRLVEHQEVVVAQEQLGERAAAALASGQAEHRPVQGDAGQQLLDDLTGARVGRPLVVGAAAEHGLADGVGVLELVLLVEVAEVQSARSRHASGVRFEAHR